MSLFFACLVLFVAFAAAETPSKCAGNLGEGETMERGLYWYKCNNGILEPQGCVDDNSKKRVAVGDTVISARGMEITCQKKGNFLAFVQTACMYNGQRVAPGASIEDNDVWYTCEHVTTPDDYLMFKPSGCIKQGKRMNFMERTRDDTTLYECHRVNQKVQQTVVGCVFNGQDHMLGENFNDDKNLYTCETDAQGKAVRKVFGCMFQGKAYYDYQVYIMGDQIFKCEVNDERSAAVAKVTGCNVQMKNTQIEKQIGCFWIQEDETKPAGTESYLMNCVMNDQTGKSQAQRTRCLYSADDGTKVDLEPGCFRTLKNTNTNVGCVPGGDNGVQITTFASDRTDLAFLNRLKVC